LVSGYVGCPILVEPGLDVTLDDGQVVLDPTPQGIAAFCRAKGLSVVRVGRTLVVVRPPVVVGGCPDIETLVRAGSRYPAVPPATGFDPGRRLTVSGAATAAQLVARAGDVHLDDRAALELTVAAVPAADLVAFVAGSLGLAVRVEPAGLVLGRPADEARNRLVARAFHAPLASWCAFVSGAPIAVAGPARTITLAVDGVPAADLLEATLVANGYRLEGGRAEPVRPVDRRLLALPEPLLLPDGREVVASLEGTLVGDATRALVSGRVYAPGDVLRDGLGRALAGPVIVRTIESHRIELVTKGEAVWLRAP
jgi:hypothetical protein